MKNELDTYNSFYEFMRKDDFNYDIQMVVLKIHAIKYIFYANITYYHE